MKRVGIYAGTFDPIHEGHLAFARSATNQCGLDKVFFLVEPRPRRKQGVRALEHREAMVRLVIAGDDNFGMILLEQSSFSVEETLPKLRALYSGAELYMLLGEDVFAHLNSWPHIEELLEQCGFIVGIRKGDKAKMQKHLRDLQKARGITFDTSFIETDKQDISSSKIRLALKRGIKPNGMIAETADYITEHGLYERANEE